MHELNAINNSMGQSSNNNKLVEHNKELMYQIMNLYAEDIEARYFAAWKQNRKLDPTTNSVYKKYDLFLWRWNGIMEQIVSFQKKKKDMRNF